MSRARPKSREYSLVPVRGPDTDPLSALAFVPALPVRLKNQEGPQLYAPIDTRAAVGSIGAELMQQVSLTPLGPGAHGEFTKSHLIVCDADFQPWIELRDVPFRVIPRTSAQPPEAELILGFAACLSNLRMTIDYGRRLLTVFAPVKLLVERAREARKLVSARLEEGEDLIKLGSHNEGVTMLAAGLQELLVGYLELTGQEGQSRNAFSKARDILAREGASHKLNRYLADLMAWRSQAVHGSESDRLTEREAQLARRYVRELVNWFNAYSTRAAGDNRRPSNAESPRQAAE